MPTRSTQDRDDRFGLFALESVSRARALLDPLVLVYAKGPWQVWLGAQQLAHLMCYHTERANHVNVRVLDSGARDPRAPATPFAGDR